MTIIRGLVVLAGKKRGRPPDRPPWEGEKKGEVFLSKPTVSHAGRPSRHDPQKHVVPGRGERGRETDHNSGGREKQRVDETEERETGKAARLEHIKKEGGGRALAWEKKKKETSPFPGRGER